MADLCPFVKWSGIQMMVWKPDWKKPVYDWKCQVFEWSPKSLNFTIWIPDTHTVWYSDESGIQMATVVLYSSCPWFLKFFCFGLAGRVLAVLTCLRQQTKKYWRKIWSPCEFGSGRLSLGTRCMTVVFPVGKPSAARVTLPWRNRPW